MPKYRGVEGLVRSVIFLGGIRFTIQGFAVDFVFCEFFFLFSFFAGNFYSVFILLLLGIIDWHFSG
jgi:hypothetical protein